MKHLLFDLDGTIIEPKEGIVNSIRHAADLMGAVMPSEEELHQFIGPPIMLNSAEIVTKEINLLRVGIKLNFSNPDTAFFIVVHLCKIIIWNGLT